MTPLSVILAFTPTQDPIQPEARGVLAGGRTDRQRPAAAPASRRADRARAAGLAAGWEDEGNIRPGARAAFTLWDRVGENARAQML
ncbi:hypothetical protein [Deinococcus aluminii]|uniref:hypothetical protein n=1 Tax=Deinococcus aluminii TaxID=1656885 RepID=UPI0031E79566